jgi:hypothetical protein
MSDNTIKTKNSETPNIKFGKNTKDEYLKIIIFDSVDDFIWQTIISSQIKEIEKTISDREKNICSCGTIGCKYFNQILHR